MFIVLLKFATPTTTAADPKAAAREHMAAHNAWVQRGVDEGVFVWVGSLRPGPGGAILAHETTRAELEARVRADPFVLHHVVSVEILEVAPNKVDPRLAFLG